MKLILTEKVKSLGNVGDTVNVSPGFGRNYLLPNKLAVVSDAKNKSHVQHLEKILAKKIESQKTGADELKGKLDGHQIDLVRRVASSGKLFGTVTPLELSKILSEAGFDIEKRQLVIANPIKALGSFEIKAKIFKEVEATFQVTVSQDPKQVEENQARAEEKKQQDAIVLKEKQEAEAAKAEAGEDGADSEDGEMSEDQRLKEEAMKILRN